MVLRSAGSLSVDALCWAVKDMIQTLINAAFQVTIVLVIALLVWLIFGRKRSDFFRYIGLIAPTGKSMAWALGASVILIPLSIGLFMQPFMHEAATAPNTVAGKMREHGITPEIIGVGIVTALIQTSLSEEIFFRGLIAKRLVAVSGFWVGNFIHAVVFGAIHLLIFLTPEAPPFDPIIAGAIFMMTAFSAALKVFINERVGNGSIFPGWTIHALGNLIAYPMLAFVL